MTRCLSEYIHFRLKEIHIERKHFQIYTFSSNQKSKIKNLIYLKILYDNFGIN